MGAAISEENLLNNTQTNNYTLNEWILLKHKNYYEIQSFHHYEKLVNKK